MPIDTISLQSLSKTISALGPKVFYPGFPFIIVPTLVAGLIGAQFDSSLTHSPSDRPAALDFPVSLTEASEVRESITLLVVPENGSDFFLESAGSGSVESVWLSITPEDMIANKDRVGIAPEGLTIEPFRGIRYPLALIIEGPHSEVIDPVAQKPKPLSKLELSTSDASWTVIFLVGVAVFACGASTGFMKDSSEVQAEHPSVDVGHKEGK